MEVKIIDQIKRSEKQMKEREEQMNESEVQIKGC
jgi:hypothetical protein